MTPTPKWLKVEALRCKLHNHNWKTVFFFQFPILFGKAAPGQDKYDRFNEVMGWANDMVKTTGYVANTDHLTVADISFAATYS